MKVFAPILPKASEPDFDRALGDLLRSYAQAINEAECRGGPTSERPVGADLRIGRTYFDTTLGYLVAWNGTAWVDGAGSTV